MPWRRRIGPAYELSPAELTGRWFRDNLLRVIAATVGVTLFWLATNWLFVSLCNFLAQGMDEESSGPFSASSPLVLGVKVVGSAVLAYWALFRMHGKAGM